jgi:hypothetical protein
MKETLEAIANTMLDLWIILVVIGALVGTLVYGYFHEQKGNKV